MDAVESDDSFKRYKFGANNPPAQPHRDSKRKEEASSDDAAPPSKKCKKPASKSNTVHCKRWNLNSSDRNTGLEVPQFKARRMPDFNAVVLPEKKKLNITVPQPFRLCTDQRGAVKAFCFEQMLKQEQKQMEEATLFKARPNTITRKKPFQPKKKARPALVVKRLELLTEQRATKKAARRALDEEQRKAVKEQVQRAQRIRHHAL